MNRRRVSVVTTSLVCFFTLGFVYLQFFLFVLERGGCEAGGEEFSMLFI